MLVQPLIFKILLTTTLNPIQLSNHNCLADNFYGTYGPQSLFILDSECYRAVESFLPQTTTVVQLPSHKELVFIQAAAVDESIGTPSFDEAFADRLYQLAFSEFEPESTWHDQLPVVSLKHIQDQYAVIHHTNSSAILALNPWMAPRIDTILPRFFKAISIPSSPVSLLPVPSEAVNRIRHMLATVKFNPTVASIVNNISVPQMRNDIRYLTGEDPRSPIVSRHSFSEGSRIAAAWLKERFEETGAKCELRNFLTGFAPDVICRYRSTVETTGTVIVSAHYDSRGSFGSTRHPGGNDDGSGIAAILAIAHTITRRRIAFKSNVEIIAFAGEEQGLLGSRAYARDLRKDNANITVMIQADMLAYHAPGEPSQLGLPDRFGTPEVVQLLANMSAIYSPELTVGTTSVCCSDHMSFHEQGFPATAVFERAGPIADPMYHNSGDVSEREGFDYYQLRSIAKVVMATLLHAAGYEIRHY